MGHMSMSCHSKALYGGANDKENRFGGEDAEVMVSGLVEGNPIDFLLNTGSAKTLVRRDLVLEEKVLVGKVVVVRCTHGENVDYPLADLDVEIEGRRMTIRAGVSNRLPVPILLGRDVPELMGLLKGCRGKVVARC